MTTVLQGCLGDEARHGFRDAVRDMHELWSDSSAELLESAKSLKAELRWMLRTGRYAEGEAEAAAYAYGRDLGLAWARRHDDDTWRDQHDDNGCDDCARSYGPHAPCRCGND